MPRSQEALDKAFDRRDVACWLTGNIDDPHERSSVIEVEGWREVQACVWACRLVASHRELQELQDDVTRQVHVGGEAVSAHVQREVFARAADLECLRISPAADALGRLEETHASPRLSNPEGRIHAGPPATDDCKVALRRQVRLLRSMSSNYCCRESKQQRERKKTWKSGQRPHNLHDSALLEKFTPTKARSGGVVGCKL
mmetsp:Transcript_34506/g.87247  ORF Transcript_34506/g.87247 Transcript_34506/m.87247 type:complete len:200 (+) Transcript_34506:621-1220(+)